MLVKTVVACLISLTFLIVSCGYESTDDVSKSEENGIEGTWIIKTAEGTSASVWVGTSVIINPNTISMNEATPCPYKMSGDTLISTCTTYLSGDASMPMEITEKKIVVLNGKKLSIENLNNGQKFSLERK